LRRRRGCVVGRLKTETRGKGGDWVDCAKSTLHMSIREIQPRRTSSTRCASTRTKRAGSNYSGRSPFDSELGHKMHTQWIFPLFCWLGIEGPGKGEVDFTCAADGISVVEHLKTRGLIARQPESARTRLDIYRGEIEPRSTSFTGCASTRAEIIARLRWKDSGLVRKIEEVSFFFCVNRQRNCRPSSACNSSSDLERARPDSGDRDRRLVGDVHE
jgi:hypothetical protein